MTTINIGDHGRIIGTDPVGQVIRATNVGYFNRLLRLRYPDGREVTVISTKFVPCPAPPARLAVVGGSDADMAQETLIQIATIYLESALAVFMHHRPNAAGDDAAYVRAWDLALRRARPAAQAHIQPISQSVPHDVH